MEERLWKDRKRGQPSWEGRLESIVSQTPANTGNGVRGVKGVHLKY